MEFFADRISGCALFTRIYESLHLPAQDKERAVCRLLQITPQTLRRYLKGTHEPPNAYVALLWHESDFGRATIDQHAHHGMTLYKQLSESLQDDNRRLRQRIDQLEAELEEAKAAALQANARPRLIAANASAYRAY